MVVCFIKHNRKRPDNDNNNFIRQSIVRRIQSCKFISRDYIHVDGTSFAASIVTSVIAQLVEANPQLNPRSLREVLFRSAKKHNTLGSVRRSMELSSLKIHFESFKKGSHYEITHIASHQQKKKIH